MQKTCKVAMILRSFSVGGGESVVCQLIAHMDLNSTELSVICVSPKKNTYLYEMIENKKIKIYFLNKHSGLSIITFIKMWICLGKIKPQVIHSHLSSSLYTFPYVLFHKVKVLHTVHNLPEKDMTGIVRFLLKILIKMKKAIPVGLSPTLSNKIADYYGVRFADVPYVYNPVEYAKYKPCCMVKKLSYPVTLLAVVSPE